MNEEYCYDCNQYTRHDADGECGCEESEYRRTDPTPIPPHGETK